MGPMKYFKHILMDHEIFFLCSIFIILFFKLKALKHKIYKLAIKEI